jgi:hypothetical protein
MTLLASRDFQVRWLASSGTYHIDEATTMRHRRLVVPGLCLVLTGIIFLVIYLPPRLVSYGVGLHQRSVTRSLGEWGHEYSHIQTKNDAIRAAEMLEYISTYYVPGPGYHSDPETEATLQAQRERSLSTIAAALEQFTGKDFGTDSGKWLEWLKANDPPRRD